MQFHVFQDAVAMDRTRRAPWEWKLHGAALRMIILIDNFVAFEKSFISRFYTFTWLQHRDRAVQNRKRWQGGRDAHGSRHCRRSGRIRITKALHMHVTWQLLKMRKRWDQQGGKLRIEKIHDLAKITLSDELRLESWPWSSTDVTAHVIGQMAWEAWRQFRLAGFGFQPSTTNSWCSNTASRSPSLYASLSCKMTEAAPIYIHKNPKLNWFIYWSVQIQAHSCCGNHALAVSDKDTRLHVLDRHPCP